jgi:hypothetical protein
MDSSSGSHCYHLLLLLLYCCYWSSRTIVVANSRMKIAIVVAVAGLILSD